MTRNLQKKLFIAGNVCSLQSIGLGGNEIRDEGAIHLAEALKVNTGLKSLGLGGNQICKPLSTCM